MPPVTCWALRGSLGGLLYPGGLWCPKFKPLEKGGLLPSILLFFE